MVVALSYFRRLLGRVSPGFYIKSHLFPFPDKAIGVKSAPIRVAVVPAVLAAGKIATLAIVAANPVTGRATAPSPPTGDRGTEVAMAGTEVEEASMTVVISADEAAEAISIEDHLKWASPLALAIT